MFRNSFPFIKQLDAMDCGPTCLNIVATYYGNEFDIEDLRQQTNIGKTGVTLAGLMQGASYMRFDAMAIEVPYDDLNSKVPFPCIIHWKNNHFMVVYKIEKEIVFVANPAFGLMKYSKKDFIEGWLDNKNLYEGVVLLLRPKRDFFQSNHVKGGENVFSFLKSYFSPFKKLIFQLLLGIVLASLIQLTFPFLTQSIVDYGIGYDNLSFITIILFAQLFLYLTQVSIELLRSWLLLHITARINIQIISDFLLSLMGMPISFYDTKNTGDFIQRIYDHKRINSFISVNSIVAITGVINIVLFSVVLLYFNTTIFFIFSLGTAIYIYWSYLFLKKRALIDHLRFEEEANNQSSILQIIHGISEIKFNASENRRRAEWHKIQTKIFNISIKSLRLEQLQLKGGHILNEIKNIVIVFVAAQSVVKGEITLGAMLAIIYIIGKLSVPIKDLINFMLKYQDAKLSIKRLAEIHNKKEEIDSSKIDIDVIEKDSNIYFNNVSFVYKNTGEEPTIKGLDFIIKKGQKTAIVGESGSGKTTLLKLLLMVYPPSKGSILVGNTNFSNIDKAVWRKKCGVVLQDGFIFADTIQRNITESQSNIKLDKKLYNKAVDIANLTAFLNRLPNHDKTKIGAEGVSLSGGERQRILIARAIYKNPEFLFFDEATSALDSNNEAEIVTKLEHFYKEKTVVTIAHRMSTVKKADTIIVLSKGVIVEFGSHIELIAKKGKYYNLVKEQL